MEKLRFSAVALLAVLMPMFPAQAIDRFVSPRGGNISPFLSWDTAATNIQDAIDASSTGDVVWVTNGVYAAGGKVMASDLTNRVALDKPITVRSVNGPFVTVIAGARDPNTTTNGPLALRCAWLTNGATLTGFTLVGGGTRSTNVGDTTNSYGGGAWCSSTAASIMNCVIATNSALRGGGVYRGSVFNSAIIGNLAQDAAGAASANLLNCTVMFNSHIGVSGGYLTNSIIHFNQGNVPAYPIYNISGGTCMFCCTTPLPGGGIGNISADPHVLGDYIHLASTSPCIGAGTNFVAGTDVDGQPWSAAPAIGCDQWGPAPVLDSPISVRPMIGAQGLSLNAIVAGQEPFTCQWQRDGDLLPDNAHFYSGGTTNLLIFGAGLSDIGGYRLIASNSFGMVTSAVARLVFRCVDQESLGASPPFLSWATAATNIQDAIDIAHPGDIILVANGLYASGGKVIAGDLTNRVVLDKPLIVQSVNGPAVTCIQGASDPTNRFGPLALRCAWLCNGAALSGFTLRGGATRATAPEQNGGGLWGTSTNATVVNCLITGNAAYSYGGGAYSVALVNCTLSDNVVGAPNLITPAGGGAYGCFLQNCLLTRNAAFSDGGGAAGSLLINCALLNNRSTHGGGVYSCTNLNCTFTGNSATPLGIGTAQAGGASSSALTNCIVYGNRNTQFLNSANDNYATCVMAYCCAFPYAAGNGNFTNDPQLLMDGIHLSASSPCSGAGLAIQGLANDLDGQPRATPPSVGCDEWLPAPAIWGQLKLQFTGFPLGLNIAGAGAVGQPPFNYAWYRDGLLLEDDSHYPATHAENLLITRLGPEHAGAYCLVVSNAFGMATSTVVQVSIHCVDAASVLPAAPYSTWNSAAVSVQDAIDAAGPGEIVLVTNGIYSTGGAVVAGDLTNRIVVNSPLTVASVNGAESAIIQGQWEPGGTNGPSAVRCAWLGGGATLLGFTLSGGATRTTGDTLTLQSGGGVWCGDTNETVLRCVVRNNAAVNYGGGCYQGKLLRSVISANSATQGGGAYRSYLASCLVRSNSASASGGGLASSSFVNCTVILNYAPFMSGGGIAVYSAGWNSIVYANRATEATYQFYNNDWDINSKFNLVSSWTSSDYLSQTRPDPQFTDWEHLSATSPCRGAGNSAYSQDTDIDGEPWPNPPSVGCDEFYETDFTGPLLLSAISAFNFDRSTPVLQGVTGLLQALITGNCSRVTWSYGDGAGLTNQFALNVFHTWTNTGDYNVTFTAYNYDNPAGVSTNVVVHVVAPNPPVLSATLGATNLTLTFITQNGVTYVVEKTTDLIPPSIWTPVTTVYGSGTAATAKDGNANNTAAYYRVRTQ